MTPEKLEQELKQGKLNSIYLLYGKEEYLIDTSVKKIKKLFGNMLARNKLYTNRRNKCKHNNIRNTNAKFWL